MFSGICNLIFNNYLLPHIKFILILYKSYNKKYIFGRIAAALKNLVDLGFMECVNPDEEYGRMYRITEKGERVFGILNYDFNWATCIFQFENKIPNQKGYHYVKTIPLN